MTKLLALFPLVRVLKSRSLRRTLHQPIADLVDRNMRFPSVTGSIILVHGFWGGAAHWAKVIPELEKHGWGVNNLHAVELPLTSLSDDAARLTQAIGQAKEPVWLVGHSYGGAVITEAGNNDKVKGEIAHRAARS